MTNNLDMISNEKNANICNNNNNKVKIKKTLNDKKSKLDKSSSKE